MGAGSMIFLFFVFFLIASAFVVNKYIAFFLPPDLFVFIRMGISGLLLMLLYCRDNNVFKAAKDNKVIIILIAFLTTFVPSLLRAYAFKFLSASRSSFWGLLEPFISSLWMYILYNQTMTRYQVMGCFISCLAMYFFVFTQARESLFAGALFCLGDLAQISSICVSRFGWIKAQELLQKNILQPQQLNAFTFTVSGFISLVLFFLRGGSFTTYSSLLTNTNFLAAIAYTTILGNMIAYNLYAYALKHTVLIYVSIAGLSMPLFVHFLEVLFLKSSLSPSFFVSLTLIALALFVFQMKDTIHHYDQNDNGENK